MVTLDQILEAINNHDFNVSESQIEIINDWWLCYYFQPFEPDPITGNRDYVVDFSLDGEEMDQTFKLTKQEKEKIEEILLIKHPIL